MSPRWKTGILADSLKLAPRDAIRKAAQLGADGVQVYVTGGELYPDNLSSVQRGEFLRFVRSTGLEICALCADFNWQLGFSDPEFNSVNLPRVRKCMDLAADLEVSIVTTHIGYLPETAGHPVWQEILRATIGLAEHAVSRGVVLCTETGPESPALLLKFLRELPAAGIGVNYDPANLVMCGPFDHIGGVRLLKEYIRHTHAKDGVCLGPGRWKELPLGEGGVVFPHYLAALDAVGYRGYLTIERETGPNPVEEIGRAVEFLRRVQEDSLPDLGWDAPRRDA